jgi:hypothetical protein
MIVIIKSKLNVYGVTMRTPLDASFVYNGASFALQAETPSDASFANITVAGSANLDDSLSSTRSHSGLFTRILRTEVGDFILPYEVGANVAGSLRDAIVKVQSGLEQVGRALRWRFGMACEDPVLRDAVVKLRLDEGDVETIPATGQVLPGDVQSTVADAEWASFVGMAEAGVQEPIGHELLREAWGLRHDSPRSALVIGVAAAEVGMKQLVAALVPGARSLVEDLPAPPLARMAKHTLPELPIRASVPPDRRCPKAIHQLLDAAVRDRNATVHRGLEPSRYVHTTLVGIREFLYLLDLYRGHEWAVDQLSPATLQHLGVAASSKPPSWP